MDEFSEVNLTELADRLAKAIQKGVDLLGTVRPLFEGTSVMSVDTGRFTQWRVASVELLSSNERQSQLYGQAFKDATRQAYAPDVEAGLGVLRAAREKVDEMLNNTRRSPSAPNPVLTPKPVSRSNTVFIVHGHDEVLRLGIESLLRRHGLKPVVLQDQLNKGRTIIEKFEQEAEPAGYAVILLTPDDYGFAAVELKKDLAAREGRYRARQNVIFELGYFVAKLGRSHVCAILTGEVEQPSDNSGVLYLRAEPSLDAIKLDLLREIASAGLPVDFVM